MLFAGKDSPDCSDFIKNFLSSNRKVSCASEAESDVSGTKKTVAERKAFMQSYEEEKNIEAQSGSCTFEWNRTSSLSTRSLVLQTENTLGDIDEAVLYFDEEWYAVHSDKMDVHEVSRSADEMITSYQTLTLELLERFEKKNIEQTKTLVFFLKAIPSISAAQKMPALRNGSKSIASPLISAASNAFISFAENIAALYSEQNFVNIVLVKTDFYDDSWTKDLELSNWLCSYLDSLNENLSKKSNAKKNVQWIKPGAKAGGSKFRLFNF